MDELIGQVLKALDDSPYADNTLIVFTSDHGEMAGSHQLRTKNYMYEEATAVPLIICPSGKKIGCRRRPTASRFRIGHPADHVRLRRSADPQVAGRSQFAAAGRKTRTRIRNALGAIIWYWS